MSKQRFSNNRKSRENRRTAGFTMTEILLVVAILAVLFGVTAVGLVQMQKELRQKELDSKAETIYMVAQNRLTELAASGRSDLYDPAKRYDILPLGIMPSDSEIEREDASLYYVSAAQLGENSAAQALMPTSRIDKALRDADWVIEFDPASGSVYAVFYSESSKMNYQPKEFNSLRSKQRRLKAGATVGYYGGDAVVTLDTGTLQTEIRVINEECLHAILSCYAPDGKDLNLTFRIKISDTFGNSVIQTVEPLPIANKRWAYDLMLDKLTAGKRFHEAYPKLVPGSDLTIRFRAISANAMIDAGSAEAVTNSLFASVQNGTAEILYGRHLQNLDTASGINAPEAKLKITEAVQRSHLHFEDVVDNDEDWYSLYGAKAYKPINNPSLMRYTGSYQLSGSGAAEGEQVRCVIYGLQTEKGMFDTFYGDRLCDVTLSGATITGGERAGALAATIRSKNGTTVQGCRVYLSDAEGDLTGKTEKDVRIKGSKYVGGLVGDAACKLQISDSFAATVIGQKTSERVGGLVGYAHDTIQISGSYADCYLYGQHVGGLIGGAAHLDSRFENCYAAGYIYAQKTAAGFLPQTAAHIKNAYAVIKYDKAADAKAKAYATVSACDAAKNLYYIADGGVSRDVGEAVRYETLSKRDSFVKKLGEAFSATTGGDHTFAYNLMKQGLTDYSFPKLAKLAHYGDWAADFQDETPVYYEVYADKADKSYGIFGANLDTLHKEGTAVGDGYGIIYRTPPTKAVTVQYKTSGKAEGSVTLQPKAAVKLTVGTETYYLLPFAKEIVNTIYAPADFYQPLVIDDTTYYYNPQFACTLTTEKPSQAAALVRIRTARQLYALSRYYEKYAEKTKRSVYMQGLDINYADYDWSTYTDVNHVSEQEPIGAGKTYVFDATYDGSGCTISGISFVNKREGSYDTGMFGDNRGILRNIAIVSEYTGEQDCYIGFGSNIAGGRAVAYGGVLAGRNSRTIRNCAAAGYTMTLYTYRNSTVCVGGLVGSNYGTIRECAAETPRIKLSATYANVKLGGFVGQNNGGISSCYAVADIEVMESRQGSVSTAGFAGENLGVVNTAYCTAAVVTAGSAKGWGFAPRGGTVKRCYYLNGGSYFYIEKLKAYHTEPGDSCEPVTGDELKRLALKLGSRFAKADHAAYHQKTDADAAAEYPYPAVVRRDNKLVHYGNWVTEAQLGTMGMLYWEHEVGGSNAGYHFRYIGIQGDAGVSGSSLCSAHDDGGIVKAFGYGYYYKNGTTATLEMEDAFAKPVAVDKTASQALAAQINGYTFRLYTTGDSSLYLQENKANGTWTLRMGDAVHRFTLSPFFANAFSYDGCVQDGTLQKPQDDAPFGKQLQQPGSKGNPYQIRSAMQLQYINWNAKNHNTQTAVSATPKRNVWRGDEQNTYFPYLVYVSGNDQSTKAYNYYWEQSHDLDYEGTKNGNPFHPIGSMYYTADNEKGQAYIAYFGGSYDGRTYAVKNLEIHADVNMVGLFGVTAGARLQNIVLYSEQDNVIEITDKSDRWYCIGGLVGFAAKGNNKAAQIENCTVSGYKILVSRTEDGGWGGGSVGGLAGASNMDLSKCTAVNDIVVSATYNQGYQNIRVGGLVGNLRATVDGAYCGGSIRSTMQHYGHPHWNTSVWVGGISGGIVMITYGMEGLVGPTDGDVRVKNSYTYVELPASGDHQIQSSHAIASNGEMQHTAFRPVTNPSIRIENCYAYEESVRSTDDYNYKKKQDYWNGKEPLNKWPVNVNSGRNIWLDNGGKSPYVTYQQLSDQGEDGVKAWLNAKGAAFSFVTTTENGASIDGKYSYAGSDTALEGKNYPFPTVLTQTDTLGQTVCVHYGRWVKGDLYWVGAMQSLDLLDAYDAVNKTAAFTLQLKRTKTTGTETPRYSFIDEDGQEVASDDSILEVISSEWQENKKAYAVTLRALRAGSMILRARMGDTDAFADVLLNLTAKISLLADPAEIDLSVNAEKEVTLQATSASGQKDLTKDIKLQIEVDDLNIAKAEDPIYDATAKVWKVKVIGRNAGDTRMSITASYRMTLGAQELEFLERTVVLINVTETPAPPAPPAPPESSTEPAKPPEGGSTVGTEPDGT